MDDTIHKLIATISPDVYCQRLKETEQGEVIDVVKKVRKKIQEIGYSKSKGEAVLLKTENMPAFNYEEAKADALNLWGLKSPIEQHKITYNFVSSPGSGHFSEMQGKATQMQQEASRTMGNENTVLKSILNLVYDLKEFRLRLK